jgi:hypothetical protein
MNNGKILVLSLTKISRKQQRLRENCTCKRYSLFTDNAYLKQSSVRQILRITALNRAQTHERLHVKYTVVRLRNFTKTPHEQIQSHSLQQFSICHMHKDGRTNR